MRTFTLTDEEEKRALAFQTEREAVSATMPTAIGGRWSYIFTPTSVGTAVSIYDSHGKIERELSDYDSW